MLQAASRADRKQGDTMREHLRQARLDKGMTQKQVAEYLGLQSITINVLSMGLL